MSKISQLHAELSEQAYMLGFESLGEAEQAGYGVDWENGKLVKVEDEQDKAHEAWLEEKNRMLFILKGVQDDIAEWLDNKDHPDIKGLGEVITFMEDYCHD